MVEGFFDAFKVWQAGFPHVVALMGSWLSERQMELLVECVGSQGKITLFLDEDDAGRDCRARCLDELSLHVFVKVARLPNEGGQPDQLTDTEIRRLLVG